MGDSDMAKIVKKLFLFILCLMCIATLNSCGWELALVEGLEIAYMEVGRLPDRIVYMANIDTELDLSGLTLKETLINGDTGEYSITLEWFEKYYSISHNIDFTQPGVYEVRAVYTYFDPRRELEINFWVQVIDEGIYAHIRDGTFDEIASPLVHDPA